MATENQSGNSQPSRYYQQNQRITNEQILNQPGYQMPYIKQTPYQAFYKKVRNFNLKQVAIIALTLMFLLIIFMLFFSSNSNQHINGLKSQKTIEKILQNIHLQIDNKQLMQPSELSKSLAAHKIQLQKLQTAVKKTQIIPNLNTLDIHEKQLIQKLMNDELKTLEQTYNIAQWDKQGLQFCVVLPDIHANLNGQYLGILQSLLAQSYQKFKIVYAQKVSQKQKKSANIISKFLKKKKFQQSRQQVIKNQNEQVLNNIFFGVYQHCQPGQIVFLINEAKSLIGLNVLSVFNAVHRSQKAAIVYSEYLKYDQTQNTVQLPNVTNIYQSFQASKAAINFKSFSQFPIVSFYSDIFLMIKISYLTNAKEQFFTEAWDKAYLLPLFQLAYQRSFYLNQITYILSHSSAFSQKKKSLAYFKEVEQIVSKPAHKTLRQYSFIKGGVINLARQPKIDQTLLNQATLPINNQNDALQSASLPKVPKNQNQALKTLNLLDQPSQPLNQNDHKPHISPSDSIPVKSLNSNLKSKSKDVLPNDGMDAFFQDDQASDKVSTAGHLINKNGVSDRQEVKGPNYHFAISPQTIAQNADENKNFGKRKSREGVWRNQYIQAIKKLEITNNIQYGGRIQLSLAPYDQDIIEKKVRIAKMIKQESQYLQATYKINQYKKKQLSFCVVVPSYNNVKTGLYLRNLNSIFQQQYSNYHVVYIDDASQDKTGQYVKSYAYSRQIPKQKLQIITNKQNRKPPFNIYNAITNHCKMGELALIVEGDDALIGTNVLNLYNAVYQKDKAAMLYSSYLDIFNNSVADISFGHQVLDQYFIKNSIRTIWELPAKYLLSFYVDIFKSIKVSDFKDPNNYFFWFAYDRAMATPLLEISYPRITVVKQIVYEHRKDTDKLQSPADWSRQSGQILAKKPYKPLKFFPFIQRNKYKYFYDVPIQKVVQNSDFQGFTAENNYEIEGVTKQMHIRAIKVTQMIHNVNFLGQIKVQLAQFQTNVIDKQTRMRILMAQDKQYLNDKYSIDQYRTNQLPFCILTPSYNNVKSGLYLRNLDSVFMQDYSNYHVVYIDDCSPDKTGDFVKKYLEEKKIPKDKIQVIINKENKKALANIHLGIHKYCKSGEIVAVIDGDDSFIGRHILSLFNAVYQRDNAAMAYSSFLTIHNNDRTQLGFCHDINKQTFEQNTFRNAWDLPGTHLMTFYSDVFKKIKISDLTYENGAFFDYAYDRAILTPLLEMSYPRISVIKEITYEYRNDTGINDSPDDWIRVSHVILDKKPYAHLQEFPFIQGFIVSTDKFNFKTSIETVIKNTDFNGYERQLTRKISGIAKQQHIHAIRLTELVHNINYNGQIEISIKSSKQSQKKKERLAKLLKSDKQYLQAKYEISQYKSQQIRFCIVVSSYGNVQNGLYLRNLDSIMMQDYKNYRVIYIDDASPDQAFQYVKKYLSDENIPQDSFKMIINKQMKKQLANIYYAGHNQCQLGEIMVIVEGNDAFIGTNVLNILNALYQKERAIVGYSCFLKVLNNNSTELGQCADIQEFYFQTKTFRNKLQSQKYRLMSFYTDMFRRIKVTDLTFDNGTFFHNGGDKAIMTPLMEMSYPNILVVKQILYEFRNDKGDHQNSNEGTVTNIVLSKKAYEKVTERSFAESE